MKNLKQTFAILMALALVAAGCASSGEKKEGGSYFDDATITAKVKTAIFNEPGLKVSRISVRTEDHVVELSGSVNSRVERVKAAEVAKRVDGVKKVKNELKVQ
ncbi:MAG TPA: BON domain-containing protein [Burkholderiales bacterium]|nr:BON domain-containing protein [Burkholderiales bacterium]